MRRALVSVLLLLAVHRVAPPLQALQDRSVPTPGSTVKLFFVALEDDGRSGKKIGCGDSLVAVERRGTPTSAGPSPGDALTAALADLLSIRDTYYGQSGLYNALAKSRLTVTRVSLVDGTAEIRLSGTVALAGACDAPRLEAQLHETTLQFEDVKRVAVFIDDQPIERVLSAR